MATSSGADEARRSELGRLGLGSRLRALRLEAGMSLVEAAASAGLTKGYLSQVEHGHRLIALDALDRLCGALGVHVVDAVRGVYPWDRVEPSAVEVDDLRSGRRS